jgi:hypothetical protein
MMRYNTNILISYAVSSVFLHLKKKGKVVLLHAMEALWVRGDVAPTLS